MEETILDFGGVAFYLDLEQMSKLLNTHESLDARDVEEVETTTTYINGGVEKTKVKVNKYFKNKEIDASRYETVRGLLEILFSYDNETDDSLGIDRALSKSSIGFKIAFNTLIKYGVLKEL